MNRWLTISFSVVVGCLIGIGLSPMGARASGTLIYGQVAGALPMNGNTEFVFEFRDPQTDRLVSTRRSNVTVRDGRYLAKFNEQVPQGLYSVVVKDLSEAVVQPAVFVELQAATPGSPQTGNVNIDGTLIAGKIGVPIINSGALINATTTVQNQIALRGQGPGTGILGSTTGVSAAAISGNATAVTGSGSGVIGFNSSPDGFGLRGQGGNGTGVRGQTNATNRPAVEGLAPTATTVGTAIGVRGETKSAFGSGVLGVFSAPEGIIPGSGSAGVRGIGLRAAPALLAEGDRVGAIVNANTGRAIVGTVFSPDASSIVADLSISGILGTVLKVRGGDTGIDVETGAGSNAAINARHIVPTGLTYGGDFESQSTDGRGIRGRATAASGATFGGWFTSVSTGGTGIQATCTATSGSPVAGRFNVSAPNGQGVFASCSATTGLSIAVLGRTAGSSGEGVFGDATSATGATFGVFGRSASTDGRGVAGSCIASTGLNFGGLFTVASTSGIAVSGTASAGSGATVGGSFVVSSPSGTAVFGNATNNSINSLGVGVVGQTASRVLGNQVGAGVIGKANGTVGNSIGVQGVSASAQAGNQPGVGVFGFSTATTGTGNGVKGQASSSTAIGVFGVNTSQTGNSVGGFFQTDSGSGTALFSAGTFNATGPKNFVIDHPLDPENKELYHSCIEGPEPFLYYRGTVTLDAKGEAWVSLPDYFDAINKDPQYQLTALGSSMPGLYVATEVQDNRFKIAGGKANGKVCWVVTGQRADPGFELREYRTEKMKSPEMKGKYYFPQAYRHPLSDGVYWQQTATADSVKGSDRP